MFTLTEVRSFIKRVARSGRNGIGKIRPLVEQRAGWDVTSESALEDRLRRLIADSQLPAPIPQFCVRDGSTIVCRADFAYPEQRILIELDGERYHMDRLTFQRDRDKQNWVHALGWTVYRFTWRQVTGTPDVVVATIAAALKASGVSERNMFRSLTPEWEGEERGSGRL